MEVVYKIISTFFKYVLYVSMFFIWVYYYNRNLIISLLISFAISLVVDFFIGLFVKRKNAHANLKLEEKRKIEEFSTQFLFSTTFQNINYFYELFNNPNAKKTKTYFVINNTTFVPYYIKPTLCEEDVYHLFKSINLKTKNLVVLCKSVTDGGLTLAKSINNFNFIILNETEVYFKFLKPLNALIPNVATFKKQSKLKFKELLKLALNKQSAKGYFSSAFIILLSSIFVRFKIYYIVFAFILFILCFLSYFNVWFNTKQNDSLI